MRSLLFYLLIFVVGGWLGNWWLTRDQATGVAPTLIGETLAGEKVSLANTANAEPTLVYFFAEWCPICSFQNSAIESIAEDHRVIAVAMQSGSDRQVERYLQDNQLSFTVINDQEGEISRDFGVFGVPALFVVQPDGMITDSLRGYSSQISLRLRLWLAGLD